MLPSSIKNLEEIEEPFREHYKEHDGVFYLDVGDINGHYEVAGLKDAKVRIEAQRNKAKQELSDANSLLETVPEDFDVEVWEKAKKGEYDEAKTAGMRKAFEAEIADLKKTNAGLIEKEKSRIVREAVSAALGKLGVPEGLRIGASAHMLQGKTTSIENDNPVIDSDMGLMSISDFAERWVKAEGSSYIKQPEGGGSPGSGDKGTKDPSIPKSYAEAKTAKEKVAFLKAQQKE